MGKRAMSTALVWFRRDLRLHDNPALHDACAAHDYVIPVYIHSPHEETPWAPGGASRWWLQQSLTAFNQALGERNARLIIRQGDSLSVLQNLIRETGASAVYWNRLYEPAIIARDKTIKAALQQDGLQVKSSNAALLAEPWTLRKDNDTPYQVFTPYWKAGLRRLPPAAPLPLAEKITAPPVQPSSDSLDSLELQPRTPWHTGLMDAWQPGEEGAQQRLVHFCEHLLRDYHNTRNLPGVDGVSRLSPYLHFGEISPRQIWAAVSAQCEGNPLERKGAETYLRELGWREFAHHVLYHWPHTPEQPMQERFANYPWQKDTAELLEIWQQGRTGYPLVDAGMRELWETGWMHNRVRMIVASWLVKNCRIPWQDGERWFWDTLVDADLANNTLGWQWTAGCGTDAAPYFRVFNPVRQSEQFDAEGVYIRRWLPALVRLPHPWLHRPWETPRAIQQETGFKPGVDYPLPAVDLKTSRAEALAGYERIRS